MPKLTARIVAMIVAGVLLLVTVGFTVRSCDKRRSQAPQTRVEHSQAGAASNSAADAINTVTGVGSNQAASEELGRKNSEEIHAAPGANDHVNSGVDAAGRAALCRRAAYRNDSKCKGPKP